jgi:hypothetical protein
MRDGKEEIDMRDLEPTYPESEGASAGPSLTVMRTVKARIEFI